MNARKKVVDMTIVAVIVVLVDIMIIAGIVNWMDVVRVPVAIDVVIAT
jgi:hypothetical protein